MSIEGGIPPRRLSNELAADRDVTAARDAFRFDADSTRVFHIADFAADEVHELFAGRLVLPAPRAR